MKKQNGFAVIEGVLFLVIAGILGFTGWYVYSSHNRALDIYADADSASSSTINHKKSSSQPNVYASWKTYKTKYEKLSFKYPDQWTLEDNSQPTKGDSIELSNNDFVIHMELGAYPGIDWGGNKIYEEPISFIGKSAKLIFATDLERTDKDFVATIILQGGEAQTNTKNVSIPSGGQSDKGNINLSIWFGPIDVSNTITKPLKEVLADKNYSDAKLIIQSMAY